MKNQKCTRKIHGVAFWVVFLLLLLPVFGVFAQEESLAIELTEADWTKFATVEVMTSAMVAKKTKELKSWVRNKEGLGGGARFNEIKAVWGNGEKEGSIGLSDTERIAYTKCLDYQASLQKEIIAYQVGLIRDEKVLGLELYERIASLVAEDPMLKEKLDEEIRRLKKKKG